jgi:hypothetical protein
MTYILLKICLIWLLAAILDLCGIHFFAKIYTLIVQRSQKICITITHRILTSSRMIILYIQYGGWQPSWIFSKLIFFGIYEPRRSKQVLRYILH